jgi:stage II sporulation protein AA (anti-sigma F factor antagonist)
MDTKARLIAVERQGDTLVLIPERDLCEVDHRGIEAEKEALLLLTDEPSFRNVVVDLYRTNYLGSTALGLFIQLWHRVRGRGGRMALCNVSALEKDILKVTRLAGLWPSYPSREVAITAMTAGNGIAEK